VGRGRGGGFEEHAEAAVGVWLLGRRALASIGAALLLRLLLAEQIETLLAGEL
jgi:hypothetical protein